MTLLEYHVFCKAQHEKAKQGKAWEDGSTAERKRIIHWEAL